MDYSGDSARQAALGNELILTAGPSVSALESSYVFDAARYGWNSQWNKYLTQFEDDLRGAATQHTRWRRQVAPERCT